MDEQIRRRDARPAAVLGKSLLRDAVNAAPAAQRRQADLIVTRNGVPLADQALGVRMFAEACRKK
jgi:hypothetical protein